MFHDMFFAVWYLWPAALANIPPVLAAKTPLLRDWDLPMDFGRTFRGKRVFGPNKTWRGLVSGMIIATLGLWLEAYSVRHSADLRQLTGQLDYTAVPVLVLGPLLGLGALGGDAIESFFKRQRGIASGKSWVPFDQIDYIIGATIITLPFGPFDWPVYVWMFVFWFGMHLLVTYIGYQLRLKDAPI